MYVMKLKYLIAPFVLAAAALCGCQETAEIHPVAYMTDAQKTVSKSVTIDTPPAGTEISVSSSVPVNKDTKIKISLRPDLLEEYNAKLHSFIRNLGNLKNAVPFSFRTENVSA